MSKLSKDLSSGVLHPRENIFATGTLGALNAEVQAVADGAATIGLVVTGTYVGTLTVEGSIDGANWDVIPVRPISAGGTYVLTLASAAVGRWQGGVLRLWEHEGPGGAQASATLVPQAMALLGQAGIALRGLDAIAFGQASRFGKHLPNRVSVEVAEVCTVQNLLEREKFEEVELQITDITFEVAHCLRAFQSRVRRA